MNEGKRHWAQEAVFYHAYPLGLCGAPLKNDLRGPVVPRLEKLYQWIDHLKSLGVNALYLGPLFESGTHGYDTADYFKADRRLGDNETVQRVAAACHAGGIRVVLDGVFNHVGRDFWAFREFRKDPHHSPYRHWFSGIDFSATSPCGDPFMYDTWNRNYELVKLNLAHPAVREHLFSAVKFWIETFGIDGLRLDAADCLDKGFLRELTAFCKRIRPDFWLAGEIIHGDYRAWIDGCGLDSVTNYECYKGLYSSHNDKNYFEIAYSLDRQFSERGMYRHAPLYNFADNHDVNRVASALKDKAHLFPLYALLFTMPGIPSLYYGSEWGIEGSRSNCSDTALRPCLDIGSLRGSGDRALVDAISRFSRLRRASDALRYGSYRQLAVAAEQFVFARETGNECIVVAVNASPRPAPVRFSLRPGSGTRMVDLLNRGEQHAIVNGNVMIPALHPRWAHVLKVS